jgi:plasmid stabilization system protein ParE
MNIRYSPRSTRDLQSIFEYLTERSPQGAVDVLTAIYAAIEFIRSTRMPLRRRALKTSAPRLSSGIGSKRSKATTSSKSSTCAIRRGAFGLTIEAISSTSPAIADGWTTVVTS